jgi:hypothetical protein
MYERSRRRLEAHVLCCVALVTFGVVAHAGSSQFTCGDLVEPAAVSAGDALVVLRTAVELEQHPLCAADADGNRTINATDALRTLRFAVGQQVSMNCPFCCELCECTPQQLTLTLDDVAPCEGCIPRVPASNTDVDSVEIDFAVDLNDQYVLDAVGECEWAATVPGGVAGKTLYGSSVSDCTGSSTTYPPSDITLRVTRTAEGWEARVGQYAFTLGWGDVASASIGAASCEAGGDAASENETCHLAANGNPADRDTHAVEGQLTIAVTDPQPVCP